MNLKEDRKTTIQRNYKSIKDALNPRNSSIKQGRSSTIEPRIKEAIKRMKRSKSSWILEYYLKKEGTIMNITNMEMN